MKNFDIRKRLLDGLSFGFLLATAYFSIFMKTRQELEAGIFEASLMAFLFFAMGALASLLLDRSGVQTLGGQIFRSSQIRDPQEATPWHTTFWGLQLIVTFAVLVASGIFVTEVSIRELMSEDGFQGAVRIFKGITSPNFEILPKGILAIIETIFIALIATVFAVPVAFLLAFFSAKNLTRGSFKGAAVYTLLRSLSNMTRSIEPIIWAIIFSVWVGIGPFAGALSLMLHSIASLTKQYSEIIECVDDGPIEGIRSTGAGTVQVVWFAVVPQIILPYVSFTIYRWDINVRMATVIGLVGGGGIGQLLMQYQGLAKWPEVGCLVLLITIVVWSMDAASSYIREALK